MCLSSHLTKALDSNIVVHEARTWDLQHQVDHDATLRPRNNVLLLQLSQHAEVQMVPGP